MGNLGSHFGASGISLNETLWQQNGLGSIFGVHGATDFPYPWSIYWMKSKPGNLVFTYKELGHDIAVSPDSNRRRKLQSIIKLLHYPKGWVTFWPYTNEDGTAQPFFFERGYLRLQAIGVVFFSSDHEERESFSRLICGPNVCYCSSLSEELSDAQYADYIKEFFKRTTTV